MLDGAAFSPPGPGRSWLGLLRDGVALLVGRARPFHDLLADWVREYGDLVLVRVPNDVIIASRPDYIRQILTVDAQMTMKHRISTYLGLALGNGLITAEGDLWARNHRLVAPVFSKPQLAGYAPVFSRVFDDLDQDWSGRAAGGQVQVQMTEEMSAVTLRAVALAMFGMDIEGHSSVVGKALADIQASLEHARSPAASLLLKGPLPPGRQLRRGRAVMHAIADELVAEHRANPDTYAGDALSRLLEARDDDGQPLSSQQLRDEVTTLLLAGHETTALVLSWAWLLLHQHPHVAARLHVEVDALPPGPLDPALGFEPALPFTRAVIAETLRLYPPVWAFGRKYVEEGEIGGCPVKPGTDVFLPQWVMHHDARWWGDDAAQFRPDRWLREDPAAPQGCAFSLKAPGHPRDAFFPFGMGKRVCLGEGFAWTEAVIGLATLARRWSPILVDGWIVDEEPLITLRPKNGLPMILNPR